MKAGYKKALSNLRKLSNHDYNENLSSKPRQISEWEFIALYEGDISKTEAIELYGLKDEFKENEIIIEWINKIYKEKKTREKSILGKLTDAQLFEIFCAGSESLTTLSEIKRVYLPEKEKVVENKYNKNKVNKRGERWKRKN